LCLLLLEPVVLSAATPFTALYVFGDGVCTTTDNVGGGAYYHGQRYSNGRVWVELLAQWQGLTYESNKNWSYYGHYSPFLVTNVDNFFPTNPGSALFVVWVADADFVYNLTHYAAGDGNAWSTAIAQSVTNHWKVVTNLYAKGARTLVMPNAVDLMKVPAYVYAPAADKAFVRQQVQQFNVSFAAMLNQARLALPAVTIYEPDMFAFFDNVISNAPAYGLTNVLYAGESVAALDDPYLADWSLNGPGANYIFWDDTDPTAKCHAALADVVQQVISPAQFSGVTALGDATRLDLRGVPVGRNGVLEGSTNFVNWVADQEIVSTNVSQSLFVPANEPQRFYRARFPLVWTWP
jgi:phospholipase/lecithinase/hemolysin